VLNALLRPVRFRLDQAQLTAALAHGRIRVAPDRELADGPPTRDAMPTLGAAGLLAEDGQLKPEVAATLQVAAAPAQLLSVLVNRAGQPDWQEAIFLKGRGNLPFVAQSADGELLDLALLPTTTDALLAIDELLGLTDLVAVPSGGLYQLDLGAYAALLATADALQVARLRARLSRQAQPEPVFSAELLEEQLQEGLRASDTRWAVTAGQFVCPARLESVQGRLGNGMAALGRAGLMATEAGGGTLTGEGFVLASALGQIVNTAGLTVVVRGEERDGFVAANLTFFRCVTSIWVVTWSEVMEQAAQARVFALTAPLALELVRGLLEPVDLPQPAAPRIPEANPAGPPVPATPFVSTPAPGAAEDPMAASAAAPRFCSQCGAPATGKKFCTACGHRLGP
jgi:hypothetical protein